MMAAYWPREVNCFGCPQRGGSRLIDYESTTLDPSRGYAMNNGTLLHRLLLSSACALAVAPVWAQYKVVQPDGRVIYTDRPPADQSARVSPVGTAKPPAGSIAAEYKAALALAAGLPTELRTPVQRYPVTLIVNAGCAPCDNGRQFLQLRGIPYIEKQVLTEEDGHALERLTGARNVPALMIGTQPLRGFAEADWTNFLDAAGYPPESRLPKGWKAAEATPLAERVPVPAAAAPLPAAAARPEPPREALAPPVAPPPGKIRF